VNGMTCAAEGEAACKRLLPDAMWVPYIDPGYTLACELGKMFAAWKAAHGTAPAVVILKNHGIFVAGDTIAEIDGHYERVIATLTAAYKAAGICTSLERPATDAAAARAYAPALRTRLGEGGARAVVHATGYFEPIDGPLTPDHIVYSKSYALKGEPTPEAIAAFTATHGYAPVIVAVPGQGTFAAAENLKTARLALEASWNEHVVTRLTAAFGGPRTLDDRERGFIENWEVESYRKNLVSQANSGKRLTGKIALVTGGAQGFGLGISQGLAAQGATLVIADMNAAGAAAAAESLNAAHGEGTAFSAAVNVADEASVIAMMDQVVCECGGLDLLIPNAGVLRAGSVKDLSVADFEFVTKVNYTGYFICVKQVAPIMAAQNVDDDGDWMDIVQISSKSGLEGSNKNGAYAGSKFGGIGLTQSFALELVSDRIKVNSVCPGNFLDGPLWSDPEHGLFVQYLKANKVPGAKTIEDVRKFYEAKVPMNRGCTPEDVVRAISYCVEQKYETGQAIPVTGGQCMLR